MSHVWPEGTEFRRLELGVEDRSCSLCSGFMHVCDHRIRHVFTLGGSLEIVCRLTHCPDPACDGSHRTVSPEAEMSIAPPKWAVAWDVFAWIGHRRFARHWSVPQIHQELADTYGIALSPDAIELYIRRYQTMLAARQQDPAGLRKAYRKIRSVVISIDGLQPEKGHETLYVVRELRARRVWFSTALISSAGPEVRELVAQARRWAKAIGKPVVGLISDKQDTLVQAIAAEFPGIPHRYCANHFLRDLAKPMLKRDSEAKVQMRRKVRGLRAIEKEVLAQQRSDTKAPARTGRGRKTAGSAQSQGGAKTTVLKYCAAVRGILNDDQGGPLSPPGLKMSDALGELRRSIRRCESGKKGGSHSASSSGSEGASIAGKQRSERSSGRSASRCRSSVRSGRPSSRPTARALAVGRRSTPFTARSKPRGRPLGSMPQS